MSLFPKKVECPFKLTLFFLPMGFLTLLCILQDLPHYKERLEVTFYVGKSIIVRFYTVHLNNMKCFTVINTMWNL